MGSDVSDEQPRSRKRRPFSHSVPSGSAPIATGVLDWHPVMSLALNVYMVSDDLALVARVHPGQAAPGTTSK